MSAVGDAPVKSAGRGGIKTVLYEDCPIRAHADGVLAALAGTSVPCDQGAAFGAAKSSGSGGRGILRYDGFRPVLTIVPPGFSDIDEHVSNQLTIPVDDKLLPVCTADSNIDIGHFLGQAGAFHLAEAAGFWIEGIQARGIGSLPWV